MSYLTDGCPQLFHANDVRGPIATAVRDVGQAVAGMQIEQSSNRLLDFKRDFGAKGNGVDLDDAALQRLSDFLVVRFGNGAAGVAAQLQDVYVPPGTYLFSPGTLGNFENVRFIGPSSEACVFRCVDPTGVLRTNIDHAEGLGFWNLQLVGYAPFAPRAVRYSRCHFTLDPNAGAGRTSDTIVNASPTDGGDVEIDHCRFDYPQCYVPLRIYRAKNITVRNCEWSGSGLGAAHALRIEEPKAGGRIVVDGNWIHGRCKTAIFFAGFRGPPVENILVEGNRVEDFYEEGIALEGFGNNSALCPVIANGTITAVTNAADGRLVITPLLVYHDGVSANVACPLTLRADWTSFLVSLGYGSGMPGMLARVKTFDDVTLTLDVFAPASEVTVGGNIGVHGGFVGTTIRRNTISGGYGLSYAPGNVTGATAISLYLNVFGSRVEGNTVYGSGAGIRLVGGKMISTYECLAWNNRIVDNDFYQVARVAAAGCGPIVLETTYSGRPQYGNRARGNRVHGGVVSITGQADAVATVWDSSNELLSGATQV